MCIFVPSWIRCIEIAKFTTTQKPKERFIQCAYMLKVSVKRTLNSYQVKGFG